MASVILSPFGFFPQCPQITGSASWKSESVPHYHYQNLPVLHNNNSKHLFNVYSVLMNVPQRFAPTDWNSHNKLTRQAFDAQGN